VGSSDSERAPVIGVSGRRFPAGRLFKREDAVAVVLPPGPVDRAAALRRMGSLDGLVLTGGPDVDPSRYFADPHTSTYGVDDAQDTFDIAMLLAALELAKPVLAICRGLQIVNVAFGGTLHQHLPDLDGLGPHGVPDGGGGTDNRFELVAGSLLATVVGATSMAGRCHHHQAVDRVGEGLAVVARTADGVVEGLELTDEVGSWFVAVQWHPEETADEDRDDQALFDHLVEAAAR
jgi:putative glutamine amidotransferase